MNIDEKEESSEPWSFRDKKGDNSNEINLVDKLTQKLNQTLIKLTQKKNKVPPIINYENYRENIDYIDIFNKNSEKELEIFESERKERISKNNKNILLKIDCTLSDLELGKGTLVTKDDLILELPSNFLNKTNTEDIGNSYNISISEINPLIPNDEFISKLHLYYSQNVNSN